MKKVLETALPVILLVFLSGCQYFFPGWKDKDRTLIASAFGKNLYLDEFLEVLPSNASSEDSLKLADDFIRNWAKQQVLLEKARMNLSSSEMDINKEIEAYRNSLLIYRYQERMVNDKLDTDVTDDEIQQYYADHEKDLALVEDIFKATMLKVPTNSAPKSDNVKKYLLSDKASDHNELEKLIALPGARTTDWNNEWVTLNTFQRELPLGITVSENPPKNQNAVYSFEDESYTYFFYIREIMYRGLPAPLSYVSGTIRSFILMQRKNDFLSELENDLYEDAVSKRIIKINKKHSRK